MPRDMGQFGSLQWLQAWKDNRERFLAIQPCIVNAEGLVPTDELLLVRSDASRYELWLRLDDSIRISPTTEAGRVTDLLVSKPSLWKTAALRISDSASIASRAPVYGVPFQRAVRIALAKGFMKCRYYLPPADDDTITAQLLLHINRLKDSNGALLQLQAWQCPDGSPEVFYVHALSPDFSTIVTHLDGAVILFSDLKLDALFAQGRKYKGQQYAKQFRLDGQLPLLDAMCLIRTFFPVEELTNEAFSCETT